MNDEQIYPIELLEREIKSAKRSIEFHRDQIRQREEYLARLQTWLQQAQEREKQQLQVKS